MASRYPEEIELGGLNGKGPTRTVHYDDDVADAADIEERPYFSSDGNISYRSYNSDDSDDPTYELPSRKIATLTYKNIGAPVRRRKTAALQTRAKAKARRPTHIYNTWREDPEQLYDEILGTWREEDAEEAELDIAEEVSTAKRIEELRDMPINLGTKIRLRNALRSATIQRKQGTVRGQGISSWTNLKYSLAIKWEHAKSSVATTLSSMGLWEGHLKAFAGHFGTDVTAYFLFMRWLFVANVIIGVLILAFLFIPNTLAIFAPKDNTTAQAQQNKVYSENPMKSASEIFLGKAYGEANSSGFFTGKGMYYGDYATKISFISETESYNMQLAYLLTYGAYFLTYFLVIAISVAKSYRTNFIESSDKFTFQYVLNILDGWDYMIDSANTAEIKHKNRYRDLREFCASNRERGPSASCCDSMMLLMFRAGAVCIMLMLIALCAFTVHITYELSQENATLKDVGTPIVITAINSFVPFVFTVFSKLLKFTYQKSVVYLSLIMTMMLYGATLGVFFVEKMFPCSAKGIIVLECLPETCWETRLGEKAYSLVIIDFLFGLVITLVSEVIYRLVAQFCCKRREEKKNEDGKTIYPQFDIARNTMAIIYNQFLLWLGIYYSPLLTVVVVIKLWITFYIKRVTVMNACVPTTKPWRAAKMHTIFLGLLFIGFIVCIVFFAMALAVVEPSDTCGPFAGLDVPSSVVTQATEAANHYIMDIVISPGVVVGIIVVLCVIVHYVRVTSAGRKTLITLLKIQITLESKDKAYLRHMLDEVQRHKTSRQEARPCGCIGVCRCNANSRASRDSVAPLRHGRKQFAKERSANTITSLLSTSASAASLLGSREDLSKADLERF